MKKNSHEIIGNRHRFGNNTSIVYDPSTVCHGRAWAVPPLALRRKGAEVRRGRDHVHRRQHGPLHVVVPNRQPRSFCERKKSINNNSITLVKYSVIFKNTSLT